MCPAGWKVKKKEPRTRRPPLNPEMHTGGCAQLETRKLPSNGKTTIGRGVNFLSLGRRAPPAPGRKGGNIERKTAKEALNFCTEKGEVAKTSHCRF